LTKDELVQYLRVCADLADAPNDGIAHVAIVPLRQAIQLLEPSAEPRATQYGRFPPGTKVRLLGALMPGVPLEGWKIENIDEPRPLYYRVRHPNGSLCDVAADLVALDPSENRKVSIALAARYRARSPGLQTENRTRCSPSSGE